MNLYDVSVPVFIKMLENLAAILEKSRVWVAQEKQEEATLLQAKLAPDMFPLVRQVQIASDAAKAIAAHLSGGEVPKMEDTESTMKELVERTQKTIAYLKSLDRSQFEGAESRIVPFPYVPGTYMLGQEALLESNLPNFFFHVTTAYDILRAQGVPLGKADYLGHLPLKPVEKK